MTTRRGFTLIETLCVVALLALAAGMLSGSLVGVTEASRRLRIESDVRRVDGLGRIAARGAEPGTLCIAIVDDGHSLAVIRREMEASSTGLLEALSSSSFGPDATIAFVPPQESAVLLLDGSGRSVDVAYVITRALVGESESEPGSRILRLRVIGATGQFINVDEALTP